MSEDFAASNVNRVYSLAATCIAIFTFMLLFMYPRYETGEIDPLLFQTTLAVMALATFSFVFATLRYYGASRLSCSDDGERRRLSQQGDRFWLLGYSLLFLVPSLILLTVGLTVVASVWFALWLTYLLFVVREYPRFRTPS